MDPASIISIIEGSISLILQCGSVVKSLRDISQKHKKAKLAIVSVVSEVDTIGLAWSRIRNWSQDYVESATVDVSLLERLDRSLENGIVVISALQDDLARYTKRTETFGFRQRSRAVWDEQLLRDHQDRIRGQAMAMSLLLQVLNLPTVSDRNMLLWQSKRDFDDSDESAKSIVPSRLSISTYRSSVSVESAQMSYRHLSFENDLFTAHVYKRNYRTAVIDTSLQQMALSERQERLQQHKKAMADRDFFYACAVGDHPLVKVLLDAGQDVHAQSDYTRGDAFLLVGGWRSTQNFHAIHLAAATHNLEVAKILLNHGAGVNQILDLWELYPLHLAAFQGDLPMVELLLNHGANIYAEDKDGNQAIHLATYAGSIQVILRLLYARADPACTNSFLWKSVAFASFFKNFEAYRFLEDKCFEFAAQKRKRFFLPGRQGLYAPSSLYLALRRPWEFVFPEPVYQICPSITISSSGPFEKPDFSNHQQVTDFWQWETHTWPSPGNLKPKTWKVAPKEGQELQYGVSACKDQGQWRRDRHQCSPCIFTLPFADIVKVK